MARTKDFAAVIRAKLAANSDLADAVEDEAFNAYIAANIREARIAARMTQKRLADLAGTQQSVISRIEDADYDGHSLGLLKRIAKALGKKLRLELYSCPAPAGTAEVRTFSVDWQPVVTWQAQICGLEGTASSPLKLAISDVKNEPTGCFFSGSPVGELSSLVLR